METLKVVRKTFTMLSEKRTQVLDITKQIRDIVLGADIKEGIILVNSLHTTCALFVNEFQGALVDDLKAMMERLVADDAGYKHDDPRFSDWITLNPTRAQKDAFCSRGAFSAALVGPCADAPVSALMDLRSHNGAYMRTNGIDLFARYKIGDFKFGLLGTYVLDYSEAPLQSFPVESYEGTQNHPVELRLRGSTTWTRGRFSTTGIVNYSDSYRDTWSVPSRRVSSWTTLDLNLAYQFGEDDSGARVSVNVENAFNDLPPFLNNSVGLGYDAENADLTGRVVSFRVRRNW